MTWAEAYLRTKWHLNPPTARPQYINVTDRTDIQRSHGIGRNRFTNGRRKTQHKQQPLSLHSGWTTFQLPGAEAQCAHNHVYGKTPLPVGISRPRSNLLDPPRCKTAFPRIPARLTPVFKICPQTCRSVPLQRQQGQHELTGQRAANFRRDLGAT